MGGYCANNPVMYYDPSGKDDCKINPDAEENVQQENVTKDTETNDNYDWSGHDVIEYMKLKEQYKMLEAANDIIDYLIDNEQLPDNYITKEEAYALGWGSDKALENYAPGKAIDGDVFENSTGILPEADGRIWYEADIGQNYSMSRSNSKNPSYRLLFSNDGLIYGTFDHYETVFEIISQAE